MKGGMKSIAKVSIFRWFIALMKGPGIEKVSLCRLAVRIAIWTCSHTAEDPAMPAPNASMSMPSNWEIDDTTLIGSCFALAWVFFETKTFVSLDFGTTLGIWHWGLLGLSHSPWGGSWGVAPSWKFPKKYHRGTPGHHPWEFIRGNPVIIQLS